MLYLYMITNSLFSVGEKNESLCTKWSYAHFVDTDHV